LTPKQKAFVASYVTCFNAAQAARDAGYSAQTSSKVAYQLLKNPVIRGEIDRLIEEKSKTVGVDAEWVLQKYIDLYEKCMQLQEVTDRKGNPTGEFQFDSAGAAKALEMISRYTGGFDRKYNVQFESDTLRGFLEEISGETVAPPRERDVFDLEWESGRTLEHQDPDQEESGEEGEGEG